MRLKVRQKKTALTFMFPERMRGYRTEYMIPNAVKITHSARGALSVRFGRRKLSCSSAMRIFRGAE